MKSKPGESNEVLEEFVPFKLRPQRSKRQLCIIIKPAKGGTPIWDYDKELVLPIALGHVWTARLASGEFGSTNSLAAELRMDPSQVMRYMRLTRLAPDIIESILCGEQPSALKQEDLFKHLPAAWV